MSALRDQVVYQLPLPLCFTKELVSILCRRHCLSDDLHYNYPITEDITLGSRAWHWSTGSLLGEHFGSCVHYCPHSECLGSLEKVC